MNSILAFNFDAHPVRVVLDDNGEPWFVAADVCTSMTIRSEQTRRLDEDEKGLRTVQTPGGPQSMMAVNESGLYSLILQSRKPAAKRFKRWITREVLPSIRRTGSYASGGGDAALCTTSLQDRVQAILAIGDAISRVSGVKPGMAMAAALTVIQQSTGLDIEPLRRVLPAANDTIPGMNPTQIGKQIGLSARAVNLRLQSMGLQFKNECGGWELTHAGQNWGEALPYSRNGHSGYQILWSTSVIEPIRGVAE